MNTTKSLNKKLQQVGLKILFLSDKEKLDKNTFGLSLNKQLNKDGYISKLIEADKLENLEEQPLDFLIINSPERIGKIHHQLCQTISELSGVIIVTKSAKSAFLDIKRSLIFMREYRLALLGVVELDVVEKSYAIEVALKEDLPYMGPFDTKAKDATKIATFLEKATAYSTRKK